jgi:predicted membrane channel-forming protein YqfA (hemolysin III family)
MPIHPPKSPVAHRLRAIGHFCTAFAITMEGLSRLEMPEKPWPFIILCWTAAAVILTVTLAHHRLGGKARRLEIPIYLLEAIVCANIGILAFHEHKKLLPYAWLLVSVLWVNAAVIFFIKTAREKKTATGSSPKK